jgi:acyl-CoA dehydrogenase
VILLGAVLAALVLALLLLAAGMALPAWISLGALPLWAWWWGGVSTPVLFWIVAAAWALPALVLGLPPLRRVLVAPLAMRALGRALPTMSETERAALEAGTVWWEGQLFSGAPRWSELLSFRPAALTPRERAFLEGPTEELCRLCDDWEIVQRGDLSPETWDFLRTKGFLGMIIPEAYGGLGFSARAHSAVITRLTSRSLAASVSVMVPNSLGPAELLLHYGTEAQKKHWLPRLARGDEIPCFALTGPENGSDAAAMRAEGVVEHGVFDGVEQLVLRLRWDKRYTTLSSRATVIGLAFKLRDPERLLGGEVEPGITVALVAAHLPGIEIGARHDPLGVPFINGPHHGRDVIVPVDAIIGGAPMAGHGWRMLMDCLAAGRGISLPSVSAGSAQLVTRVVGAYASVRRQFGLPLARFEGIEEKLARIAGLTYLVDATRRLTTAAVDAGEKPSVATAIAKAWCTEAMRVVVEDGTDILGGAAICRGPRNAMARVRQAVPIGITVEGANILTRTLIVFGQGAVRCHPWVQREMAAVASRDLHAFDRAFFGHVAHVARNGARAFVLAFTGGAPALPATVAPEARRAAGRLSRLSTDFAFTADMAMATLGGTLKRREMLSGRLADALAWLFLGSAAWKRWADDGCPASDRDAALWALEHAEEQVQLALRGVIDNLPNRPAAALLRLACFPLGAPARGPSDARRAALARAVVEAGELRVRLGADVYVPPATEPGLGQLEAALAASLAAAPAERKLKDALRAGRVPAAPEHDLLERAVAAGALSEVERATIEAGERARDEAIAVDAYGPEEFVKLRG